MEEQDWTPFKVTQDHMQNLVSQGFMTAAEVTICRMLEDPVPSTLTKGCSLLQHYCLDMHNLTLSGILHITTFVTLCEDYMGIDPHFDLWNYFFHVRHPQDPNTELAILEVTRFGTMGTQLAGLEEKEGGGANMNRPTGPEDLDQEAHY
jgi:hypothetical protein